MQKKLFQMHFPSLPLGWNFAEETFVNYKFDQINLYHHNKRYSDKDDDEEMKAISNFNSSGLKLNSEKHMQLI